MQQEAQAKQEKRDLENEQAFIVNWTRNRILPRGWFLRDVGETVLHFLLIMALVLPLLLLALVHENVHAAELSLAVQPSTLEQVLRPWEFFFGASPWTQSLLAYALVFSTLALVELLFFYHSYDFRGPFAPRQVNHASRIVLQLLLAAMLVGLFSIYAGAQPTAEGSRALIA